MFIPLYDCLPINNIYRPKNRILFRNVRQDHGRFEVNQFLIYFIKRTNLQDPFINASTLSKQIDTTARTKLYRKLNRRQKISRQHTASAEKKEYFDGTLFRY